LIEIKQRWPARVLTQTATMVLIVVGYIAAKELAKLRFSAGIGAE
jgi:hypothetical protein